MSPIATAMMPARRVKMPPRVVRVVTVDGLPCRGCSRQSSARRYPRGFDCFQHPSTVVLVLPSTSGAQLMGSCAVRNGSEH